MTTALFVHPAANQEADAARSWYDDISTDLGNDFAQAPEIDRTDVIPRPTRKIYVSPDERERHAERMRNYWRKKRVEAAETLEQPEQSAAVDM
jgi:hypothetical protein